MSRLHTSFVLGYHGCDSVAASKIVSGEEKLRTSNQKWDWLGPGIYFWEADCRRALEWADWRVGRGDYDKASAVGAVIDLRNCLDLTNRENLELIKVAYHSFIEYQQASGFPLPENKALPGDPDEERRLRYLDCAVFKHLHKMMDESPMHEPFDTVRGLFVEGNLVYPGCGYKEKNHVQIAVLNPECIRGVFNPREPFPIT